MTCIASVGRALGKTLGRWLALALAVAALIVGFPSLATETPAPPTVPSLNGTSAPSDIPEGNKIDGFPVVLDGESLFLVREGVEGVTTAQERAAIISQRITGIASDPAIAPEAVQADIGDDQSVVRAGETVLFTVREDDAKAYGQPHPELAATAVERIQQGLIAYREKRSLRRLGTSILAAILSTVALVLFLKALFLISSKLLTRIQQQQQAGTLAMRFQSMQLLGSGATSYLLSGLVRFGRLALILGVLYLYVPFVLSQFPATETVGDNLLQDTAYRLTLIIQALVAYLPKLATIAMIMVITYYIVQFAKQVIIELGRHDVYPWFYPEWIQPTIRLATLLIAATALVMAGPYLPGFGSPAFQGVSLFVGALLTLGSSSAVANALSGIILIYTRAFQLGDFIRIDDIIGEVQEKSLFVTRVLTPKQETVTIPNASVLNHNVINYSAICRESNGCLLLYTTITLGYDLPWRKVHEALVAAAQATAHIAAEPRPFVLQTDLNDFNVSYQLNAYTSMPTKMPRIYSELHQNIQDYCNQADIEILSPHFSALRDGNHSTIPADYLPEGYQSPGFVIQKSDGRG
ncbi:mechanosensitive ion channel [Nodosilinea sp. LEGE 07088]|uniref:mechanosensitive ion channel family protein n=1 Tax=Nodosilinea sp. LEGE 07088 TaxID=2777968 RepID=UPI001882FD0B|nr:mechanosensitive ion channel domain-containing protein [Nodosilinea sp. LEGE 07088]MBE9140431.1 mechanosensitive ion channel [Nodosilinea sp. LEGE 07088]